MSIKHFGWFFFKRMRIAPFINKQTKSTKQKINKKHPHKTKPTKKKPKTKFQGAFCILGSFVSKNPKTTHSCLPVDLHLPLEHILFLKTPIKM